MIRHLLPVAIALVALTGSNAAQPKTPQRLISLVPALTEIVYAIGAGERMVAVSSYDQEPPAVRALPQVGALLDPDVERIITLRPDLVLAYGSQQELMAQLTRVAIPFFQYRHGGLRDVTATIRALGERLAVSMRAEQLARAIETRLEAVRQQVAAVERPRTLLVFSRERGTLRNIYVSGGHGFLHDMVEAAGGRNVFADVDAESLQASSEQILARAPEVILELRATAPAGNALLPEMSAWHALPSVPAVKRGRLLFLLGRHHVVPGPRVAESVEAMAAALHPALKFPQQGRQP